MDTKIFNAGTPEQAITIPAGTFLLAYRGSIAHGLHDPSPDSIDDIDLIGGVIAPAEHYLGLAEWGRRGTVEIKQGRYDCVFYEIRKLVRMLLQGNPNVLSLLWTDPGNILNADEAGQRLREARQLFVGRHVYRSFAEYAHQQLDKMEARDPAELREYLAVTAELKHRGAHPNHKGETFPQPERDTGEARSAACWDTEKLLARLRHYLKKGENIGYMGDKRKRLVLERGFDCKNAAHCLRLLRLGEEFLRTGEMTVDRRKAGDAEFLLKVKNGLLSLDEVKEMAESWSVRVWSAYVNSPLPEGPDTAAAERMLVGILRQALTSRSGR